MKYKRFFWIGFVSASLFFLGFIYWKSSSSPIPESVEIAEVKPEIEIKKIEEQPEKRDTLSADTLKMIVEAERLKKPLIISTSPICFRVDNVEQGKRWETMDYKKALTKTFDRKLFVTSEDISEKKLIPVTHNGLVSTVFNAYADHQPLILSPDIIWLAITQGVSIHVDKNIETLDTKLMTDTSRQEIRVRIAPLVDENPKYWRQLIDSFSLRVQQKINPDFYAAMSPTFSQTTPDIKAVYNIVLMNAFKKVFKYVGEGGCGIPYITLEGTPEDWEKIYHDIDKFKGIGLDDWIFELKPILEEFHQTSQGNVNREFWQYIIKDYEVYGGNFISGWIIKFFPYLVEEYNTGKLVKGNLGYEEEIVEDRYIINKFIKGRNYLTAGLSIDEFPAGFVSVPVTWVNLRTGQTNPMTFLGGFSGIEINEKDGAFKPSINWAIAHGEPSMNAKENYPYLFSYYTESNKHKQNSKIYGEQTISGLRNMWYASLPIYDLENYDAHAPSMLALKKTLMEKYHKKFGEQKKQGQVLKFKVLISYFGLVEDVEITSDKEIPKEIHAFFKDKILRMREKWLPAYKNKEYRIYAVVDFELQI